MPFDLSSILNFVSTGVAILGAFTAALWLSLTVWTFRDMRSRSRDIFAQLLAALVVAVLNVPGLIVYLILPGGFRLTRNLFERGADHGRPTLPNPTRSSTSRSPLITAGSRSPVSHRYSPI